MAGGLLIRDDIDVQIRCQFVQPVHQILGAAETGTPGAAAQHDFGNAADAGILRDLYCRVVAVGGGDFGAQFLGQMHIVADPLPVLVRQGRKLGRLHKKRGKRGVEGFCHPGGGPDDLGVGGGGGEADQDMFAGFGLFITVQPGRSVQTVRCPPQGDLP